MPQHVAVEIREYAARYGRLQLERDEAGLVLRAANRPLAEEISRNKHVAPLFAARNADGLSRRSVYRGQIKQALVKIGFPAEDLAGYRAGEPLPIVLRGLTTAAPLRLAALPGGCGQVFHAGGGTRAASGGHGRYRAGRARPSSAWPAWPKSSPRPSC